MLMPSIFGESLMDDFFDFPFGSYNNGMGELMKTDVKDTDQGYELKMNLPGAKKEDVKAQLKDGYLTIQVSSNRNNDEKARSFYVGDQVTEEDIKAKFEDGTLTMTIPKKEQQPQVEDKKYISIEG